MALPAVDTIRFLIKRKFPNAERLRPLGLGSQSGLSQEYREERLAAIAAYKKELESKPSEELRALYEQEKTNELAELKARAQREEQQRFFNQSNAHADFGHWSKASYWTLEEATALSFGKGPEIVSWESIKPFIQISSFAQQFARRRDLLMRAKVMTQLYDPVLPGFFLAWAKRNNIPYPHELEAAVVAHGHQVADWKSNFDELKTTFDQLKELLEAATERGKDQLAKIADLEREQAALQVQNAELRGRIDAEGKQKPLLTRERETALKLIIGMAIEQYTYDPEASRSDAIKNISDDLAEHGLSLDMDTIRKWLKEAAQLLTGTIVGASKIACDISDRKGAQARQELLLKEMGHRVKNAFTLVNFD
jgi:two-component sensor histidine kinase